MNLVQLSPQNEIQNSLNSFVHVSKAVSTHSSFRVSKLSEICQISQVLETPVV